MLPQSGVNQTYYYDQVLFFTNTHTHMANPDLLLLLPLLLLLLLLLLLHTHVLHTPILHPGASWQKRSTKTLKKNSV